MGAVGMILRVAIVVGIVVGVCFMCSTIGGGDVGEATVRNMDVTAVQHHIESMVIRAECEARTAAEFCH